MRELVREATEELEREVRQLMLAYQRGLEEAYAKYTRAMTKAFEREVRREREVIEE